MNIQKKLEDIAFKMQVAEFVGLYPKRENEYIERLYEIDEMKEDVFSELPQLRSHTFDELCKMYGVYSYFNRLNWPVAYWDKVPKLSRT